MIGKMTKKEIEDIFKDISKPKERSFRIVTSNEGMLQFNKALKREALIQIIKLSNKPLDVKTRLYILLDSGLETDFTLVNEIMKTSLNYE